MGIVSVNASENSLQDSKNSENAIFESQMTYLQFWSAHVLFSLGSVCTVKRKTQNETTSTGTSGRK